MYTLNPLQQVMVSGIALAALAGYGCATQKYVHRQVDPVAAQVKAVDQKTAQNTSAIRDVETNVSQVDEKAMGADRKAQDAANSAQQANEAAANAQHRADEVGATADHRFGEVRNSIQNIDNFQQVSTGTILFGFNKSVLTKEAKDKLDQLASGIQSQNRYVIEVEGFTDPTGPLNYNLDLSRKRADAVVRYLTLEHNIPLRRIHVLGAGEVAQEGHTTRTARREERHVKVNVYAPATTAAYNSTKSGDEVARQ